jgi:hypothetical protein
MIRNPSPKAAEPVTDRKHEKHLAYYQMLDALRRAKQCVFCDLERKGIAAYFGGLLYEKVNDPGIRGELVKSGGFCPRHAFVLASFGDGLGTAILYADQIQLRMKSLEQFSPRQPQASYLSDGTCPACRTEGRMRASYTRTLLLGMEDQEMRDAFACSAGLCFPHFATVLMRAENLAIQQDLIRAQKQHLSALSSQLQEFINKYDYRRTSEEFNEERNSWLRAVEMISGLKDVF